MKTQKYSWEIEKFISIKIHADVLGPLAVHPTFNGKGWTITHLKTGYHFGPTFESQDTAEFIVQELVTKPVWDFVSVRSSTKKFKAAREWAIEVFERFGYGKGAKE